MSTASITVRVPEPERADWIRSAKLAGLSLSEWIRKRCANGHNQSVRDAGPASLDQRSAGAPDGAAGSNQEAATEPEPIPRTRGTCVHGKRKGMNCWQCGGPAKA